VPITVRLEPEDAQRLRALCRAAGFSQAAWIARAINEAPNDKGLATQPAKMKPE
jgi:predicted HicB family RNase H-like nuclease